MIHDDPLGECHLHVQKTSYFLVAFHSPLLAPYFTPHPGSDRTSPSQTSASASLARPSRVPRVRADEAPSSPTARASSNPQRTGPDRRHDGL